MSDLTPEEEREAIEAWKQAKARKEAAERAAEERRRRWDEQRKAEMRRAADLTKRVFREGLSRQDYKSSMDSECQLVADLDVAEAEIARLRAALEWYADRENWRQRDNREGSLASWDRGDYAREALKGTDG